MKQDLLRLFVFKASQMAAEVVEESYALLSYIHMFKERIFGKVKVFAHIVINGYKKALYCRILRVKELCIMQGWTGLGSISRCCSSIGERTLVPAPRATER
jgi:hypothetical protein